MKLNQARIQYLQDSEEFHIDEGCFIRELSNSSNDPEVSIAMARVPPGVTTEWHRLQGVSERYLILQGEGLVEVGELPASPVRHGDTVLIPAGCRQRISNPSADDLVFLAICSPRFTPDCYQTITD